MGLIIGDALGVPVEFSTRHDRDQDPVRGFRSYGSHAQPVGAWSDDGALALAHATAFIDHGWNPERHLEAFLDWHEDGRFTAHGVAFDIGFTTRRALKRFSTGRPLDELGGRGDRDNGNGSLMRMLPAACWWSGASVEIIIQRLGEVSALTHAHRRSRLFCALYGLLVDGILGRKSTIASLLSAAESLEPYIPAGEEEFFAPLFDASWVDQARAVIPSDGYVVSTLIAACWCLSRHEKFSDAVLEAVNLGGDTDTTAAVTGSLAGLRCGFSAIPKAWTMVLPGTVELIDVIARFARSCRSNARACGWA